jgi:phage shock protein E
VVDVRGTDAFEAGHIPGALSVPLAEVERRAAELKDLKKPIVLYCA